MKATKCGLAHRKDAGEIKSCLDLRRSVMCTQGSETEERYRPSYIKFRKFARLAVTVTVPATMATMPSSQHTPE